MEKQRKYIKSGMNKKHEIRWKKQIQNKTDNNKCKWRKYSIYRKTQQTEVEKKYNYGHSFKTE